jgi:cobalt transporter subunit CbtA
MAIALMAGAFSGLIWFGLQYIAVIPLIETAEKYEAAAGHHEGNDASDGSRLTRNSVTAVTTILTSIGFAALLFGVASLSGQRLDVRSGALWGLAGFACVSLGPFFGLPPRPPGSAVADLTSRQIWWTATVIATAVGSYCIARSGKRPMIVVAGLACLLLPHLVGAPAASGQSVVPAALIRQFEIRSLTANGIFWVTLGVIGGLLSRNPAYIRRRDGGLLSTR